MAPATRSRAAKTAASSAIAATSSKKTGGVDKKKPAGGKKAAASPAGPKAKIPAAPSSKKVKTAVVKPTRKTAAVAPAATLPRAPTPPPHRAAPATAAPTAPPPPASLPSTPRKAEVVFSFDTTGSMYACLTQVRRKIKECVERLFRDIGTSHLRIGITAHGDYGDDRFYGYVTKHLPLTTNVNTILDFVENVGATGGGDAAECYELVLHEAQDFAWMDGWAHVLILIGDDVPHERTNNPHNLKWRDELDKLKAKDVVVHGVQALNRQYASKFYAECARRTGGCHLPLDQFSSIADLVMAVCYRESHHRAFLEQYEQEIQALPGRYSRSVRSMFDTMLGRANTTAALPSDLNAVPPGRFQVLDVDSDTSIKDFVQAQGVTFKKGRGFYEFTKPETVQDYKEIILRDPSTGDMFEGAYARSLLGLPSSGDAKIRPETYDYDVFIQSTSVNRKLIGGTKFLYEVEDY
ncbi:VWA domain-containing protein [Aphelenchoides fujianensis]|nr:VWA domain-containing protein [Aphelenchoides fujianensis]